MKKYFYTILSIIICISISGCSINLGKLGNTVDLTESEDINLTSYVILCAMDWLEDFDTDINPNDYFKNIKISVSKSAITDEAYEVFREQAVGAMEKYVLAVLDAELSARGYDANELEKPVDEFAKEVLGMPVKDYVNTYMADSLVDKEYILRAYNLSLSDNVENLTIEPSGVQVVGAEDEYPVNLFLSVDGASPVKVKGLHYSYKNNLCISLRDLAMAMMGTGKAFSLEAKKNNVSIVKGGIYEPIGNECQGHDEDVINSIFHSSIKLNNITVNGEDVKYYNFLIQSNKQYDVYMRLIDAALLFDLEIINSDMENFAINTDSDFSVNITKLNEIGYFDAINAALVGDASTGEIYYSSDSKNPYPIASISKLMTYALVEDAIAAGQISETDFARVSVAGEKLSKSDDGYGYMKAGMNVTVIELLYAMLLSSSNEATLTLAEFVSGSEEEFVKLMNTKALELGLNSAEFHTCNGLPSYTQSLPARKLQNYMSANDLFTLITYIFNTYPDITNITSVQVVNLPSLGTEAKNTNPLVYNMSDISGLKSGSTTRAGICQTASKRIIDDNGKEHHIVAIELGAETGLERGTYIEILMRYGMGVVDDDTTIMISSERQMPDNAAGFVLLMVTKASEHGYIL